MGSEPESDGVLRAVFLGLTPRETAPKILTEKEETQFFVNLVEDALDNAECKNALAALRSRLSRRNKSHNFGKQLRGMLGGLCLCGGFRQTSRKKPDRSLEQLSRRLKRTRRFIEEIEKPPVVTRAVSPSLPYAEVQKLIVPEPPLAALRVYADGLERSLAAWRELFPKRKARRTVDPDTELIRAIASFIRLQTGRPHWAELAILLRHVTGDRGWTAHRLEVRCAPLK